MNYDLFIDIDFWGGYLSTFITLLLAILSLTLIVKVTSEERCRAIVFWPCIICATLSLILFITYAVEFLTAYYSSAKYEMEAFKLRLTGLYWYAYVLLLFSTFSPRFLFLGYFRKSIWLVFTIAVFGLNSYLWNNLHLFISTHVFYAC